MLLYVVSLWPTPFYYYNPSLDTTAAYIWYVVVFLLVCAALRRVVTRFLVVHVTHVYNDQIDSVFAHPEIRIFGKKK